MPKSPLHTQEAWLWAEEISLPGRMALFDDQLTFQFQQFPNSHLSLSVPLNTIEKIDTFLLFDRARNGLRVQTKDGRTDFFIVENPTRWKDQLETMIK